MPSKKSTQASSGETADDNGTVVTQPTEINPMLTSTNNGSEEQVVDKYADIETQCGAGSCRPKALRPFGSLWMFTIAMSVGTIVANMNFTYYSAVITQIERRFGLSSAMTGFIKNIDNIGFMSTILIASHLGRHANKPRLLAASTFLSGLAIFLFAVPHFMYGGPPNSFTMLNETNTWNATVQDRRAFSGMRMFDVCHRKINDAIPDGRIDSAGQSCDQSASTPLLQRIDFHRGALFFFVLSELLQGAAISPKTTLSMTYMDDNAKDKSPQHFGFMFGMRAFAPMLGFLLGAWTNTIYVDLSKPDIDQKDPRWIGAWWIGFVICAVCTSIWAIPFALFPKRFAGSEIEADSESKRGENDSMMKKLKDMPKSLWRLITNPVYISCILGTGFNSTIMGFSTFLPKYYQSYFGVTPAVASIWTGVVTAMSFGIGNIVSGPIVSRLKASISRTMLFVILVTSLSIAGYLIALLITCPEAEWAGNASPSTGFNGTSLCNADCSCNPAAYSPVCGSDGRNYFSPCYAGCLEQAGFSANQSKKVFTNCECVEGGTASLGLCERNCSAFYVYITVIFVTYFTTSMLMVPIMTVKMRCVDKRDKAMALALSAFFMQITSFPAPMLYGRAIDSICLVQQQGICNKKGACLLYDHNGFRWRLHVLPLFAKAGAVIMYLTAWLVSRKRFPEIATINNQNAEEMKIIEGNEVSPLELEETVRDAKEPLENSTSKNTIVKT